MDIPLKNATIHHAKALLAAIALVLSTTTALPAGAQATAPGMEYYAQGQNAKLNLTADQKAKIKRIRQESRQKIQAILTPEQKSQWESAKKQGLKGQAAMRTLNLSQEQRAQIREIQRAAREQISAILTPEQRQQMGRGRR